jgi:hypothetical protein
MLEIGLPNVEKCEPKMLWNVNENVRKYNNIFGKMLSNVGNRVS